MMGTRIFHAALDGRTGHAAGRALLAAAYAETVGGALPEIRLAPGGKPYFPDSNVEFSITHTRNHAFCVLSSVPVGIDAEQLERKISPALAKKICSPAELARCYAADDFQRAVLALWVLKEAAAKCTGEGLRGYPNHTNFDPADPRVLELDGCLVAVIEETKYVV